MKTTFKAAIPAIIVLVLTLVSNIGFAQMQTYTWDSYKTKFDIPTDFKVTTSTGELWTGTNDKITVSLYPRKDENLTTTQMQKAIYDWAVSNDVKNIGELTILDEEKLNGYWGYLYEGTIDGNPVATMLISDPDFPEITIYIWISYLEGQDDTVIEILKSFTPS